ncbi:MAG TPA: hypothetical protein VNY75_04690 [Rhizomicrobium sp.]|nr:hypothetical protein [Rhizomicrobium sp.]
MRAWLLILALLFAAPAAQAAPTCQDRNGDTIKCGAPGAMPVGWTPSPQQLWDRSRPPSPSKGELLSAFGMVGLILALIALLPEFHGWREEQDEE